MPKCKNDETRSYAGTEPSPKGRGYCAHTEEVGKRRKGKDGQLWIVRETKRGKLWFKVNKSVKSPRGYGDYSPVARKGGPAYSPTERKKRQNPSAANLGLLMGKFQKYEPGIYNEIARGATGFKGQNPIGEYKKHLDETLKRALNDILVKLSEINVSEYGNGYGGIGTPEFMSTEFLRKRDGTTLEDDLYVIQELIEKIEELIY